MKTNMTPLRAVTRQGNKQHEYQHNGFGGDRERVERFPGKRKHSQSQIQSPALPKPSLAVMRKHRANVPVILFTEFFSCSFLFYIFVLAQCGASDIWSSSQIKNTSENCEKCSLAWVSKHLFFEIWSLICKGPDDCLCSFAF